MGLDIVQGFRSICSKTHGALKNSIKKAIMNTKKPASKANTRTTEKASNSTPKTKKPTTHKIKTISAKEKATAAGEPWVSVISVEVDPADVNNGSFELDWNEIFVARLIKAGFQGKTDQQIVDQWFREICRNVLLENFEQQEANNPRIMNRRDLGAGRSEIS